MRCVFLKIMFSMSMRVTYMATLFNITKDWFTFKFNHLYMLIAISPKIRNRENCKNLVNSVLLYLAWSVMDQMKSSWTVECRFTLPSHFSTMPTPGKGGKMWKDIAFWSEYCVLMQCGCIYRLEMWIKMQHSVFKISNNEENIINLANLRPLWSTSLSSWGVDHKDRR